MNRLCIHLPILLLLGAPAVSGEETAPAPAPEPEAKPKVYKIGDKVELAKHADLAGGPEVDLAKLLEASEKGIVLVWYSPICPACVGKVPEITEFVTKYTKKGWTFVGIFSGGNIDPMKLTPEQHLEGYTKQKVPFPVLDDRAQKYVKPFGLKKTPTFAAITKDSKLGFLGAPWDLRDKTPYLAPWLDASAEGSALPTFDASKMTPWG
ncbi:MAG: peroxiredoxin family protein [Planctomycetaceae bacterium]